ncbi:MAG: acyltransferase family protein [Bacteroidales bacterium]
MERRYDIDFLRVVAIGLLLVYHIGIGFQPFGVFIGFIQNDESLPGLWTFMSMLNVWRIPLLFFVSGMGVAFSLRKRNLPRLLLERSQRILLPFLFGMVTLVPLHMILWQSYYHQDIQYKPAPGHLWFLGNIFLYVLVLSPLFLYLRKRRSELTRLERLFRNPFSLMLVVLCFVAEAEWVPAPSYATYALTFHGLAVGFLGFFFGFMLVRSGSGTWSFLQRTWWILAPVALGLFLLRRFRFDLEAPSWLMALESCLWVFAVLGFGRARLNRPGPGLFYLSQAAYPVYILHMVFLYLGSVFLFPLPLPAVWKFIFLNLFTFAGCFLSYEFLVRRIRILRPLFGLKPSVKNQLTERSPSPTFAPSPQNR